MPAAASPPLAPRQRNILLVLGALVFLISGLRFDGPSRGYWDTYITVPAMFMTGQPVDLLRVDGTERFDYQLKGVVPDDTFDPTPGSFGIASKDQRVGTGILFAAPFALFAKGAFRWGYAATWTLLFGFGFIGLRRLTAPRPGQAPAAPGLDFAVPLLGTLFLVFNPFSLYLDRLNGNLFGLAFLVFLWVLLSEDRPSWWLCGLVYGIIGGIRNEAIVVGPMMLAFMAWSRPSWQRYLGRLAAFTAAAFAAILPVLIWNDFAYGQAIIHPSQVAHLEGFRPTFPHTWFGLSEPFEFNGLLNWPFHTEIIRTPHFAYPTWMHWPLVTIKSMGLLLTPIAAVGSVLLLRRQRFLGALLWFWYVIVAVLFVFQENWEELKQTFMALHLFPLAAFVTMGLVWVAEGLNSWKRASAVGVAAVLLAAVLLGIRQWEVPADERWYVRFPHAGANDTGMDGLPVHLRKDWHFFYTHESPEEIEQERWHMTQPWPWPSLYRPVHLPDGEDFAAILEEPVTREHRTLAIWSYIYE
jgi:hypothetical protein